MERSRTVCLPVTKRTFAGTVELAERAVLRRAEREAAKAAMNEQVEVEQVEQELFPDNIVLGEQ